MPEDNGKSRQQRRARERSEAKASNSKKIYTAQPQTHIVNTDAAKKATGKHAD